MDAATLVVLSMQVTLALWGIFFGILLVFFPDKIVDLETRWMEYMLKFRKKYMAHHNYKMWLRTMGMMFIALGLLIISLSLIYITKAILK